MLEVPPWVGRGPVGTYLHRGSRLEARVGKRPMSKLERPEASCERTTGLVNWDKEVKLESNADCKFYLITY